MDVRVVGFSKEFYYLGNIFGFVEEDEIKRYDGDMVYIVVYVVDSKVKEFVNGFVVFSIVVGYGNCEYIFIV